MADSLRRFAFAVAEFLWSLMLNRRFSNIGFSVVLGLLDFGALGGSTVVWVGILGFP